MKKIALTAASAAILGLSNSAAQAETITNSMTNIVTLVDACDMIAIGVDFGVRPSSLAADITNVLTPNNATTGQSVTGNGDHTDSNADGAGGVNQDTSGSTNDDTLSLVSGVGAVDTAINLALSTVPTTVPGVFVVCTTTPTSLTVASDAANSTPVTLPLASGAANVDTFQSDMFGNGDNGAAAAHNVNYRLAFAGPVASVAVPAIPGLPGVFTGFYTATGRILASEQTDGAHPAGYYTDVATATLEF